MFRNYLYLLIIFLLGAGCAKASPAKIVFELQGERVEFEIDDRKWTEGSRQETGNKGMVGYLLPGEKLETWSEMITLNYFKSMQGQDVVQRLLDFTKKGLESACQKVNWQILSQDSDRALYIWSAQSCTENPDQSEIGAILLSASKNLYVLHYAGKKTPLDSAQQEMWRQKLSSLKTV